MRIALTTSSMLAVLVLCGCESSAPTETAEGGGSEIAAPPPPQPAAPATETAQDKDQPAAEQPADGAAAPPEGAKPPAAETNQTGDAVEAKVGAGAKGRDYGGPGFVTTPIEALFRADDLVIFEAHIPKNLELYKAEHNNQGPKSHEEFMQVIIKDGGVKLPELPEGEEYWYDAKTEKLMVRHPKPKQ